MYYPGNPIPLARPRISNSTYKKVYDSQRNIKLVSAIQIDSQHDNQPFLEGPIQFNVTFFMPISLNKNKKLKQNYHLSRPDLDNMVKFILDVAQGIIYSDDCIVSSIVAHKVYDKNPRTEFFFLPLNPQENINVKKN